MVITDDILSSSESAAKNLMKLCFMLIYVYISFHLTDLLDQIFEYHIHLFIYFILLDSAVHSMGKWNCVWHVFIRLACVHVTLTYKFLGKWNCVWHVFMRRACVHVTLTYKFLGKWNCVWHVFMRRACVHVTLTYKFLTLGSPQGPHSGQYNVSEYEYSSFEEVSRLAPSLRVHSLLTRSPASSQPDGHEHDNPWL